MDFVRKRRRAFHRKRKSKSITNLSMGGNLERSHNMVVGRVFRNIQDPGSKVGQDVYERVQKRINKTLNRF